MRAVHINTSGKKPYAPAGNLLSRGNREWGGGERKSERKKWRTGYPSPITPTKQGTARETEGLTQHDLKQFCHA